jgi:hypothetical protein
VRAVASKRPVAFLSVDRAINAANMFGAQGGSDFA